MIKPRRVDTLQKVIASTETSAGSFTFPQKWAPILTLSTSFVRFALRSLRFMDYLVCLSQIYVTLTFVTQYSYSAGCSHVFCVPVRCVFLLSVSLFKLIPIIELDKSSLSECNVLHHHVCLQINVLRLSNLFSDAARSPPLYTFCGAQIVL